MLKIPAAWSGKRNKTFSSVPSDLLDALSETMARLEEEERRAFIGLVVLWLSDGLPDSARHYLLDVGGRAARDPLGIDWEGVPAEFARLIGDAKT